MILPRALLHLAIPIFVASSACAQRYYTLTDLGDFGYGSVATGISSNGLVGGYADIAPTTTHAFVYSSGEMFEVETLGGTYSSVLGINGHGFPVGTSQIAADAAYHAFVHNGTTMLDLGVLPGGTNSSATAITDRDLIVGFSEVTGGRNHAFAIYAEGMTDLGTLVGGSESAAYAANESDHIAGTSETSTAGVYDAVVWADGQVFDLGNLGGTPSRATSLNDRREVVGFSYLPGNNVCHGFYFYNGEMADIGTLGGSNSKALDINQSGELVGESELPGGLVTHAFIGSGGQLLDLNNFIPTGTGWTLVSASAINDAGQITGYAFNAAGVARAFLLTPATPPGTAPSLRLVGTKKRLTTAAKSKIKGTATGSVSSVTYRIGRGPWRQAAGTAAWSFIAKLKPGKNLISIMATGRAGNSPPVKLTVTRN